MKKGICLLVAALLVLAGCPSPETGGGPGSISGTVTDWVTGDPISGAKIVFGSYSVTTDALGTYRIDTAKGVSTIDGVFAVFKGVNYSFLASSGVAADPRLSPKYDVKLWPANTSAYPSITISGKVFFSDGTTEIPDSSNVRLEIFNSKGGYSKLEAPYDQSGGTGYSITSKTYGSDCFVKVLIEPFGGTPFQYYLDHQNLSASNFSFKLQQPQSTAYTNVTLNGTFGTAFMGQLVMPGFGAVEMYTIGVFSSGSTTTADIYNTSSYPMYWWTAVQVPNTPASGDNTLKMHSSEVIAFGSPINLPSMVTATGPTEIVDVKNTASWDGSTLSFTPAAGANFYRTTLVDDSGLKGDVWMATPSITFPSEFVSEVLIPGPNWDVLVWPAWSSGTLNLDFLTKQAPSGSPIDQSFEAVLISPNLAGNGFKADVIP